MNRSWAKWNSERNDLTDLTELKLKEGEEEEEEEQNKKFVERMLKHVSFIFQKVHNIMTFQR